MHGHLQSAANEVRPSGYLDCRAYLESVYQHIKKGNSGYSYQKYSDDLGFGATTLMHQIVRGYRPLTVKAAERMAKAFAFEGVEKRYFLALAGFGIAKSSSKREQFFEELLACKREALPEESDRDTLAYFSQWYHPVIWELVGAKNFRPDAKWIAERIVPNLKLAQAKESLDLLLKLGLIVFDEAAKTYKQTQVRVATGHRVKGIALVSYHQQMIEHGKASLTQIPGSRRDISGATVNVSNETAQELRSMIHAFQLQLLEKAEKAGGGDQVYQVNIQLFPFTDTEESSS